MKDHRKYIKWYVPPFPFPPSPGPHHSPAQPHSLYVYNKIDSISLTHLNTLAREPHTAVMSCELDLGISDVVERCWQELQLMRVYTKRRGAEPDFSEALIVRRDSTIEDVCDQVHRTLRETFKYALVWGARYVH